MDSLRPGINLCALLILVLLFPIVVHGGEVFRVKRKFSARTPVADLKRHDLLRHGRSLSASSVDVLMGGGLNIGIWHTEIEIGNPPKTMRVHVDTGSTILWVFCEDCIGCIPKEELKALVQFYGFVPVDVETYSPKHSKTSRIVAHDDSRCKTMYWENHENSSSTSCDFRGDYLDRTSISGYFVTDLVSFKHVSGNQTTGPANITFGCVTLKRPANDEITLLRGTEGILGLSSMEHSIFSQMASSGRIRKEVAHCLGIDGGFFSFGHVLQPKIETMTTLLPNGGDWYAISVMAIDVDVHSHRQQYSVTVDTGTTMIILPKAAYDFVVEKIFLKHPDVKKELEKNDDDFHFSGSVDAEFPTITFQVNVSHALKVYPHDYLIDYPVDPEKSHLSLGITTMGPDEFILGDVAMRNKLFVFDIDNQLMGWQDYNCSSTIELENEATGVCNVDAHDKNAHPS